eukprot:12038491-Alexandrium_andersonii.AAC.1
MHMRARTSCVAGEPDRTQRTGLPPTEHNQQQFGPGGTRRNPEHEFRACITTTQATIAEI